MSTWKIVLIVLAVILVLGIIILPVFNRWQFKRLSREQQILSVMKQANSLVYFKNVSMGRTGYLCYVKNRRKILMYPWEIVPGGAIKITKDNPFDRWDYPEEKELLNEDEIKQAKQELENYCKKSSVKIIWNGRENTTK